MKKHTSKKQTTRKGTAKETFAFYIGIDLGDKKSDICVLDEQGELHDEFRLRMNAQELQTYFGSLAPSPRAQRECEWKRGERRTLRPSGDWQPGHTRIPTCWTVSICSATGRAIRQ